jgi:hypothetical protein
MKICFEYKVEKMAFVYDGKEQVPVGIVEQDTRIDNTIKATVKIFKHIPKELVNLITENPTVLNFREVKRKAETVITLPEGDITT